MGPSLVFVLGDVSTVRLLVGSGLFDRVENVGVRVTP